jgi:hypothetical protein
MKKISAVIIDTYPDKKFASIAVKMVQRLPIVGNIFMLSDTPFEGFDNLEFIKIPALKSNNEYGRIIFENLPEIITDEHVLIFQWDGFPLNPDKWRDEFLSFDYIGAPVGNEVGNGGFSIRSKKLLKTLKNLNITVDLQNPFDQPEDRIICLHKRAALEENGIKFAPLSIAAQFSLEWGPPNKNVFGFHAPFNLPLFFNESDLLRYSDNISSRISSHSSMVLYLESCLNKSMYALLSATLQNFKNKPNLLRTYQYLSATNPNHPLLHQFNSTSDNLSPL